MVRPDPGLSDRARPEDLPLAEAPLAAGIADLIEQAELGELDADQFTTLGYTVLELAIAGDPGAVAEVAAASTGAIVDATALAVVEVGDERVLRRNLPQGDPTAFDDDELAAALLAAAEPAAATRTTLSVDGIPTDLLVVGISPAVPGQARGAVGLAVADEPESRRMALVLLMARLAAAGLDRLALIATERVAREAAKEETERRSRLTEVADDLTGALRSTEVLEALDRSLIPRLADATTVAVRHGDEIEVVHVRHVDPDREKALRAVLDIFPLRLDQPVGLGAVIASGEPQLLPEIGDDILRSVSDTEEQFEKVKGLAVSSGIVVPLKARGSTVGALSLIRDEGTYDEHELDFAIEVAERAGLALEGTRRYEAERVLSAELRENLAARARIERTLIDQRDLFAQIAAGEMLEHILQRVAASIEALSTNDVRVAVAMLDPAGLNLIDAAGPSLPDDTRHALHDVPLVPTAGPPAAAIVTGRPVAVEDIETDGRWAAQRLMAVREGLRSAWATPITSSDGSPLGVLCLYWPGAGPFDDDLALADLFTQSAAVAIERERDREALVAQRALMESVLAQMPSGVVVFEPSGGEILLANQRARGWFDLPDAVVADAAEPAAPSVDDHPVLGPLLAETLRDGTSLPATEVEVAASDTDPVTLTATAGPVRDRHGSVVAVVAAFHDISQRRRAERRLAAQHAVSRVLATSRTDDEVAPAVLDALGSALGWSAGCYWERSEKGSHLELAHGWHDGGLDGRGFLEASAAHAFGPGRGLPGAAWVERRAIWVADLDDLEDYPRLADARAFGVNHAMATPVMVRGRVHGVMELYGRGAAAEDAELLDVVGAIASQLGVHIERRDAERQEAAANDKVRHLAATLQRSLLPPSLPKVPGASVEALYRPALEEMEVGGDFYDVFQMASRDWLVVVGDVCGKGAEAAAVTALARYTLRGAAMRTRRLPNMLQSLNRALLDDPSGLFCTLTLVRLREVEDGLVAHVACAGHPRPHLIGTDGSVRQVGGAGPLVGVLEDYGIEPEDVKLDAGSSLVLYTDGLVEARSGDEFYGQDRLHRVLTAVAGRPAYDILHSLGDDLEQFQSARHDDVAIMVVQATGGGRT